MIADCILEDFVISDLQNTYAASYYDYIQEIFMYIPGLVDGVLSGYQPMRFEKSLTHTCTHPCTHRRTHTYVCSYAHTCIRCSYVAYVYGRGS